MNQNIKLLTLAMISAMGISACSGSSDDSTPVSVGEENSSISKELKIDKNNVSNYPSNPVISDSDPNIATYLNGNFYYVDSAGNTLSLRDEGYSVDFLKQAAINPDTLQTHNIEKGGQSVMKVGFVNQQNASYMTWKSEKTPTYYGEPIYDVSTSYIANLTPANSEILTQKGQATYKGHVIANSNRATSNFHLANLTLNADFSRMKISGVISNRNDELLSNMAKYSEGVSGKEYTLDPGEVDPGYVELITQEGMNQRIETYRTLPVNLEEGEIVVNDNRISFGKSYEGLSFVAPDTGKTVTVPSGTYGGVFAGDKAQEVVGEITSGSNFASFGAVEAK